MPEKAITKKLQTPKSGTELSITEARHYLARLRFQLRPELRQVVLWGVFSQLLSVLYLVALAWLLSQWSAKTLLVEASLTYGLAVLALLGVRGLATRRFDQSAERVILRSQQQASQSLFKHWRCRVGARVASEEVSLLHDAIPMLGPYYGRFVPQLWLAAIVPVTILVIAFSLDWIAALFLLLSAPLIPLFMALVGMGAERLNAQHFDSVQRLSGLFIDRIRNVVGLRLFERTDRAIAQIDKASALTKALNMRTLRVAFLSSAVLEFFSAVAIAAVAIYVGFALLGYYSWGPASEMSWFVGLLLLMLAPEFFQPLRTLAGAYHDRAAALAAAGRLAVAQSSPLLTSSALQRDERMQWHERDSSDATNNHAQLALDDLVVGYDKNLSSPLTRIFEGGGIVCIQGASGSGKSTLLKTLAGLLPPRSGAVLFNQSEVDTIAISYLAQQPFFQTDTLRNNLRLMAPAASDEQMLQAMTTMGLADFIETLPEGLDTLIGPNHFGFSGGESRRVALARIALSNSPLVLLDEPTAGLDAYSAAAVLRAIQRLQCPTRIIVIASHDLQCHDISTEQVTLGGEG